MTNTLAEITTWHQRARPSPTHANFNVQLGCHMEEFCEMLETLIGNDGRADDALWAAHEHLKALADALKAGEMYATVLRENRKDFLDSLADQVVTAVGVGHCAEMDVTEACKAVNFSNWSKFGTDGLPIFSEGGKVLKGNGYVAPDLSGLF